MLQIYEFFFISQAQYVSLFLFFVSKCVYFVLYVFNWLIFVYVVFCFLCSNGLCLSPVYYHFIEKYIYFYEKRGEWSLMTFHLFLLSVRLIGLEPTRHQPLDPKSSASTNSATGADFLCFAVA